MVKISIQQNANLDIFNPATGDVIGHVGVADAAMVAKAVATAKSAFAAWSGTPAMQRAKIYFVTKRYLINISMN